MIPREHYDKALKHMRAETNFSGSTGDTAIKRRKVEEEIVNITDFSDWARIWLNDI